MSERRITPRKKTADYHIVRDNGTNVVIGRIVNLTIDGARLIGAEEVASGIRQHCRLTLPDIINGVREISFAMESRWCEYNKLGDWYETGWVFVDLSDLARSAIEQMIRDWPKEKTRPVIRPTK
jgi:hypothetical protein